MYESVNDVIWADICSPWASLIGPFCLNRRGGDVRDPRWCWILAAVVLQQIEKSENI